MSGWNMPMLTAGDLGQMPAFDAGQFAMPAINKGPMGFGDYMSDAGDWLSKTFGGGQGAGFGGKIAANGDKLQGWGMPVVGALSGLAQGYLGYQQLGLAKDTFNENKRQFAMNWGAQQKTVNSRMEDRQRARVASNSGAYQSVGDYMKQNGI